jgi:hypothetical protein
VVGVSAAEVDVDASVAEAAGDDVAAGEDVDVAVREALLSAAEEGASVAAALSEDAEPWTAEEPVDSPAAADAATDGADADDDALSDPAPTREAEAVLDADATGEEVAGRDGRGGESCVGRMMLTWGS